VLTEAILSKGLTQSKSLDCELLAQHRQHPEVHNLIGQVVCMAAELVLLPKQNCKSLNSRRRLEQLARGEVVQSESLLLKPLYLY